MSLTTKILKQMQKHFDMLMLNLLPLSWIFQQKSYDKGTSAERKN